MVDPTRVSIADRIVRRLNLRFPALFLVFGLLTLFDLLIPDFIPFADEIGLTLLTLLFGSWKNRKSGNPSGTREMANTPKAAERPGSS
jgi:hypothetical protein